jgi:hypothetical protein
MSFLVIAALPISGSDSQYIRPDQPRQYRRAVLAIAGSVLPPPRGPRIVVTPARLNIRATGGRRIVDWDDLVRVPANPLPITARAPKLAPSVRRPGRDDPGWLPVPLVVENYVEHPDHRRAIGTREEYTRLTGTT